MSKGRSAGEHPYYGDAARRAGGAGPLGLGLSRGHAFGYPDEVFAGQSDRPGVLAWAREHGWVSSEAGASPPPVVTELMGAAPLELGGEHEPRNVLTGRAGQVDALALDIALTGTSGWYSVWAVTALAAPQGAPRFRLESTRRHLSGVRDPERVLAGQTDFDARWALRAEPRNHELLRRFAADAGTHEALLATDDGDVLWVTQTGMAAARPDGHRPSLLEHHLRLLVVIHERLAATAGS